MDDFDREPTKVAVAVVPDTKGTDNLLDEFKKRNKKIDSIDGKVGALDEKVSVLDKNEFITNADNLTNQFGCRHFLCLQKR